MTATAVCCWLTECSQHRCRNEQHAHLLAGVIVQRLDGCIPFRLPEPALLVVLAVTEHPVPRKGTVAPVVAAAGKTAPDLHKGRELLRKNKHPTQTRRCSRTSLLMAWSPVIS